MRGRQCPTVCATSIAVMGSVIGLFPLRNGVYLVPCYKVNLRICYFWCLFHITEKAFPYKSTLRLSFTYVTFWGCTLLRLKIWCRFDNSKVINFEGCLKSKLWFHSFFWNSLCLPQIIKFIPHSIFFYKVRCF